MFSLLVIIYDNFIEASLFDMTNEEMSSSRPTFLSRISLNDIWRPATRKYCGNDPWKMLKTSISILFSQSVLQVFPIIYNSLQSCTNVYLGEPFLLNLRVLFEDMPYICDLHVFKISFLLHHFFQKDWRYIIHLLLVISIAVS